MKTRDIKYYRVHRGAVDRRVDILVPDRLTLKNLDYVTQRKLLRDHGAFSLTPLQYFMLRHYSVIHDESLDKVLHLERDYERFDQVIDFWQDPPEVCNRPEVDFSDDSIIVEDPLRAPYLRKLKFGTGFLFDDLNRDTGLPEKTSWELSDSPRDSGYSLNVPPNWDNALEGWDPILITPMFRAREGMDCLFLGPVYNVEHRDKEGVRECFYATPENLDKLGDKVVGQ